MTLKEYIYNFIYNNNMSFLPVCTYGEEPLGRHSDLLWMQVKGGGGANNQLSNNVIVGEGELTE